MSSETYEVNFPPFQDLPEWVGREQQRTQIENELKASLPKDSVRYIYIQDLGGRGKTHLLRLAYRFIYGQTAIPRNNHQEKTASPDDPIASFIDFQSITTHDPEGLMEAIADNLRQFSALADDTLKPYDDALSQLGLMERQSEFFNEKAIKDLRDSVRTQFIGCVNRLAQQHRMIYLLFDTVEEFERIRSILDSDQPAEQESDTDSTLADAWEFFRRMLLELKKVVFVLAGRTQEAAISDRDHDGTILNYHWYKPAYPGLQLQDNQSPIRISLDVMNEQEAIDLLGDLGIDRSTFVDPNSTITVEAFLSLFETLLNGFSPIYLALLAEHLKVRALEIDDLDDSEDSKLWLQQRLVAEYFYHQQENDLLMRMALGTKTYFYDQRTVELVMNTSSSRAAGMLKNLQAFRFVRTHADGSISLQDEFRRLLVIFVWQERQQQDPEGVKQEKVFVFRQLISDLLERQQTTQRTILKTYVDIQKTPDEYISQNLANLKQSNLAPQAEFPVPTVYGQKLIDLRRAEHKQQVHVREMQDLLRQIDFIALQTHRDDHYEIHLDVFDKRWPLFRRDLNATDTRERSVHHMVNVLTNDLRALYSVEEQFPETDYSINDITYLKILYDDPDRQSDTALKRIHAALTLRRRQIQEVYFYKGNYQKARQAYQEVLDVFADSLETSSGKYAREMRIMKVKLLIKLGVAEISDPQRKWLEQGIEHLKQAEASTRGGAEQFRSEIYREIGWAYRMQWIVDEAIRQYRTSLNFFDDAIDSDSTVSERLKDLAVVSNNLAFALRHQDVHSAIQLALHALDIHKRGADMLQIERTLRVLAQLYRTLGKETEAKEYAQAAIDLVANTKLDTEKALANYQYALIQWYSYLATDDPLKTQLLQAMFTYLNDAYMLLINLPTTPSSVASSERNQMLYSFADYYGEYRDYEQALMYVEQGLKETADTDLYRVLEGLRRRLSLKVKAATEDDTQLYDNFIDWADYKRALAIFKQIRPVALVSMGKIELDAGDAAFHVAYNRPAYRDRAIEHYIVGLLYTAQELGYNVVAVRPALDRVRESFRTLRSREQYRGVARRWCEELGKALDNPQSYIHTQEERHETGQLTIPIDVHQHQYDQIRHFLLTERLMIELSGQALTAVHTPRCLSDTELVETLERLKSSDPVGIAEALDILERQLLVDPSMPRLAEHFQEIYDHGTEAMRYALPDHMLLDRFLTYHGYALSQSARDWDTYYLPGIIEAVADRVASQNMGVCAPMRYFLGRILEHEGHVDDTKTLFRAAMNDAWQDQDWSLVLILMNEMGRLLARTGDYLSASLYMESLDELLDRNQINDAELGQQILMTRGIIYRGWASQAATRGAPGSVDDLFQKALTSFDKASAFDAGDPYSIIREQAYAYSLWADVYTTDGELADYKADRFSLYLKLMADYREDQLGGANWILHCRALGSLHVRYALMLLVNQPGSYTEAKANYKKAENWFRRVAELGRENNQPHLMFEALAHLIELKYVGCLEHPLKEQVYDKLDPNERDYDHLMYEDGEFQEFQELQIELGANHRLQHQNTPNYDQSLEVLRILNTTADELPESLRHHAGRVHLTAGTVAQWCGRYDEAIEHYEAAGILIANSLYSVFNVSLLIEYIKGQFVELPMQTPEDRLRPERWANQLRETWGRDSKTNEFYADLIEFAEIQKRIALVNRRSSQAKEIAVNAF